MTDNEQLPPSHSQARNSTKQPIIVVVEITAPPPFLLPSLDYLKKTMPVGGCFCGKVRIAYDGEPTAKVSGSDFRAAAAAVVLCPPSPEFHPLALPPAALSSIPFRP